MDSHARRTHSRLAREIEGVLSDLRSEVKALDNKVESFRSSIESIKDKPIEVKAVATDDKVAERLKAIEDILLNVGSQVSAIATREPVEATSDNHRGLDRLMEGMTALLQLTRQLASQTQGTPVRQEIKSPLFAYNHERNKAIYEAAKAAEHKFLPMSLLEEICKKFPTEGSEGKTSYRSMASSTVNNWNNARNNHALYGEDTKLERVEWARARGVNVPPQYKDGGWWRLKPLTEKDEPYKAPKMFSIDELARKLGSMTKVLHLVTSREVTPVKVGDALFIKEEEWTKVTQ